MKLLAQFDLYGTGQIKQMFEINANCVPILLDIFGYSGRIFINYLKKMKNWILSFGRMQLSNWRGTIN